MNTILKSLTAVALPIAVLILSSSSVSAQTEPDKKVKDQSPVGTWTWERKSGDKMIESKITIMKNDGKFSGKLKDVEHDLEIKNSELKDGTFSFEVFPHPEAPTVAIKFEGKVSADNIKGTMSYTVKDEDKTVPWTAKRYDPMTAVIGKWLLEFETPDGVEIAFKIEAKKKGKKLGVTFLDEPSAKVRSIKFKDGVLSFSTKQEYEDQPISVDWELTVKGNQIDGQLYYYFDETQDEGEIEVTGERVK